MHKWTCAVQTCVVQGSAVIIKILHSSPQLTVVMATEKSDFLSKCKFDICILLLKSFWLCSFAML